MLKFITNMQISRRLLFAFLLAAVIPGIIISILGFGFINAQKSRSQAIQLNIQAFKMVTTTGDYLPRMTELLKSAYQYRYETVPSQPAQATDALNQLQNVTKRFDQAIQQYKQKYQISTSPDMKGVYGILLSDDPNLPLAKRQQAAIGLITNKLWPNYQQAQNLVFSAIATNAPKEQVASLLQQATDNYALLEPGWQNIINITEDISNTVAQVGASQTGPFYLATLLAFLSTIVIVTAIGYIIYLTIVRPLHQLALLTRRIAKGDTHARATITGEDEISLVARSINHMLDYIVQLAQEAQSQRDNLQAQVEKLVSEVSGVGEGDLRIQAQVTADAMGVLADSFNYMIDELGSLVVRVKMVASGVDATTVSILRRMTQLVETDKAQLRQIAAANTQVELMTSSTHKVAERAQALYNVARLAGQDAQTGREAVRQTIAGMGRINENVQTTASKVHTLDERSREINDIVDVISGIAHQTNRLALDAAIQAAMAGENGTGFSAVAADIRRLAERTKEEASMITRTVRSVREEIGDVAQSMQDTQQQTAKGTHLTEETGIALEAIFAAVEHQAHEIENISQMALLQRQATHAVTQIMQKVSASTRQNSTNTHQAAQSVEHLARLVEQLRTSVAAFKLRDNQNHYAPNTNIFVEDDLDSPTTVSGVLRAVSPVYQPLRLTSTGENPETNTDRDTPVPQPMSGPISLYPLSDGRARNGNNG
ncbi:MAG TPA: methyl-accepting chemotaxis protein [Ktedonobacteraceae bacterium]